MDEHSTRRRLMKRITVSDFMLKLALEMSAFIETENVAFVSDASTASNSRAIDYVADRH